MAKPPFKALNLALPEIDTRALPGGGLLLRARSELKPHARMVGEYLRYWASAAPSRCFLAERREDGRWRRVGYAAALIAVERIAASLLRRGLDADRPVAILSDNGIDNGLLQLAAMHIGIPAVPVSPAYSLISRDGSQLKYVLALIEPGLVYAADGMKFAGAIAAAVPDYVELVTSVNEPPGRRATPFSDLLSAASDETVGRRFAEVGPETAAKVLFTSGSTGKPKGVINTQRMLCSNQQSIAQLWPFLEERPPVIVDWLPWNHTFGGNHNFNLILRNGGTLYIDFGKPVGRLVETTVRNLREVAPTAYFNVPRGYDMLIPYLERDRELRENFFRDLDMMFYAGAALPQHLWEKLERLSIEAIGERVVMLSAWGSTETAPSATKVHFPTERAGVIGLPGPGTEIKLAPVGAKLELRVRGPCVTPGYWKRDDLTVGMFDEDGFLKMGDAGRLADSLDPCKGIVFDGRLAENFKLSTGAWVNVGDLRTEAITAGAPVIQDVVVAGHDRTEIGLLIFPNVAGCCSVCPDIKGEAPLAELVGRPEIRRLLISRFESYNATNNSSSRRIARAILLIDPPSIDAGEITDKGYINQRAVLERRARTVERLFDGAPDVDVIRLDRAALTVPR